MSNVWVSIGGQRVRICGSQMEEPPEHGKSEVGEIWGDREWDC